MVKATLPPFEFHKVNRVVFVAGLGFLLLEPQTLSCCCCSGCLCGIENYV